jgi:hypothetical protein
MAGSCEHGNDPVGQEELMIHSLCKCFPLNRQPIQIYKVKITELGHFCTKLGVNC